jgi:hypothetical protein
MFETTNQPWFFQEPPFAKNRNHSTGLLCLASALAWRPFVSKKTPGGPVNFEQKSRFFVH